MLYNAGVAETKDYVLYENIARDESIGNADAWDLLDSNKGRRNGRAGGIYQEQSFSNGTRNNERSGKNSEEITLIAIDNGEAVRTAKGANPFLGLWVFFLGAERS